MKRFLMTITSLISLSLPSIAKAGSASPQLDYSYVKHGISEFVYSADYQECANFSVPINLEKAEVEHNVLGLRRGRIRLTIGDSNSLALCHAPGGLVRRAVKFVLQTGSLTDFSGLFGLIHALDYQLIVNGAAFGTLRVGLVGEHEFFPVNLPIE